jgi:hypothetical protein
LPNHRQSGRTSRHRRSHHHPGHRHQRTHRHPRVPLAWRGHLAALGALAIALGAGAAAGHRLHGGGDASTALTVATTDERRAQQQAASRDLNRLAGTPAPKVGAATALPAATLPSTALPSTAPRASAPVAAGAATVRPAPSPSPVAPAVPAGCASYSGNQLIACTLLPSFGFPASQMAPLVNLWNGESGWRTTARNPSSGAYGIPQSLPAGKMASAGSDWRTNPATQIRWGLGYIKATYGTPARAWAMWQARSPHWY